MPFTEYQRYMPFHWPFIMLRHDFKGAKVNYYTEYTNLFLLIINFGYNSKTIISQTLSK